MAVLKYKSNGQWYPSNSLPDALSGASNPTSSTEALYVGQHYLNTSTNIEWVCVSINNGVYGWEIVNKGCIPKSASAHNGIYRGNNLTNIYTDAQIHAMISAGTFDDLFIGDYIEKQITTSYGGTETVRFIFAGFDIFLHNGGTEVTSHHAVLVPEDCFKTKAAMNSSNTTANGYSGSYMKTTVLPVYAAAIKSAFSNFVLTHQRLLSNSVSTSGVSMAGAGLTGYASSWSWFNVDICLMNEVQLYGTKVCSSSFYDVGDGNLQFPLFALDPTKKVAGCGLNAGTEGRSYFWLSAVASATNFAICYDNGNAVNAGASNSNGVRPYFLLY